MEKFVCMRMWILSRKMEPWSLSLSLLIIMYFNYCIINICCYIKIFCVIVLSIFFCLVRTNYSVFTHTEEKLWAEQFYVYHSILSLPKQWFLLLDFCSACCSAKGAGLNRIQLFCSLSGLLVSPDYYRDCKMFCLNLCTAWLLWGCQSADEPFSNFSHCCWSL